MSLPFPRSVIVLGRVLLLSLGVLLAARGTSAQSTDEEESPEVEKLIVEGVKAVDEELLRESIATKESNCKSILLAPFCWVSDSKYFVRKRYLDRVEFRRDVVRVRVFYWKRGFRETQVDTSIVRRGDGVAVTFRISEGPPTLVSSVRVDRPEKLLSDKYLSRGIRPRAGRPFDLVVLDSTEVHLRNDLWEQGYSDAVVLLEWDVVDSANAAALRISIDPRWVTRVGRITITGNEKVSQRTISRSLALESGDVFKRSKVLESQRNLYTSNLFSHAEITVSAGDDSVKEIAVIVDEAPLRDLRLSGGFSTVDFGQTEARYTRYNWLGSARQLDLRGAVSNLLAPQLNGSFIFKDVTPASLGGTREDAFLRPNWQASADLVQPWFRSTKNSLGASVFGHRRSAPGIFIDRGYGASASFTRRLGERAPLTASYRFEVTEVEAGDVYFCVNYGVCDRGTIDVLGKRQRLSPLALSFFVDRTNDVVDATSGYSARADAEHASTYTGSTFRYHRAYGETARYFTIHGDMVLAGRVRAGWVKSIGRGGSGSDVALSAGEDILHPRKRFYAGGSQSVRGYGENQLGPRILTVDPDALIAHGCTEATIANGGCDPNPTPTDAFQPQPLGGESLLEGSVELRFPLWKMLRGAVFVDAAVLGHQSPGKIANRTGSVTPGFGVRFRTPLGPIRVDLGVRPRVVEDLPVVTQVADSVGGNRIVTLRDAAGEPVTRRYDPLEGSSGAFRKALDRLTLHFSIGHAF